jgi:hypothetical protein
LGNEWTIWYDMIWYDMIWQTYSQFIELLCNISFWMIFKSCIIFTSSILLFD